MASLLIMQFQCVGYQPVSWELLLSERTTHIVHAFFWRAWQAASLMVPAHAETVVMPQSIYACRCAHGLAWTLTYAQCWPWPQIWAGWQMTFCRLLTIPHSA